MTNASTQALSDSIRLAQSHYENFPVASPLLPRELRKPISLIYAFARQADDFADEGNRTPEERLALLNGFRQELDLIQAYIQPNSTFFVALGAMIRARKLPLQPFYDLLDAFSQDVTKTRYADFNEVMDYCRRSANPIGTLLLHLYGRATPLNLSYSNAICSALQLINFWQDIAIDIEKNRIYLPQDEMRTYGITENQIAQSRTDGRWMEFIQFQIDRARGLLHSGKPIGIVLPGRIGLEMRTIIAGGECILDKLQKSHGDMFAHRPVLTKFDWVCILLRAVTKR